MLLDDVGVAVSDALESVREVEAITDFLGLRLDEIELTRIGEPAGNQRCRLLRAGALSQTGRKEGPKLDARREACRDRQLVLGSNGFNKPSTDRSLRHLGESRAQHLTCERSILLKNASAHAGAAHCDGYRLFVIAALHAGRGYVLLAASPTAASRAFDLRDFNSVRASFRFPKS